MRERLIVTGAAGFVAGSVLRQAGPGWELHALARGEAPSAAPQQVFWHQVDLREAGRLRDVVRAVRPRAIIHAAAMADIDRCESNRDEAFAVNVGVTEALVALCRETGARMVYVSTDTVFDGKKGRYRETDPPGPINYYAETKVRAESSVSKTLSDALIARLSLVVGFPVIGAGNSFLAKIVPAFEAGRQVGAPADEYRTPIDVITAGRALLELAGGSVAGCVHLAGNDRVSRFELLRRVAARMGYPTELVVARAAGNAPARAPRPQDVSLDNTRARAVLATPMVGLDRALDLILNARKGVFP